MSKIGKQPIEITKDNKVEIGPNQISIAGPKGSQTLVLRPEIKLELAENKIYLKRVNETKMAKSLHGLYRTLIYNMMVGVTRGWEKVLEIVGTGFSAKVVDSKLILNLGFSHPIEFTPPPEVSISISENKIKVIGLDKAKVGEVAAQIRALKPPDPYKGKGIRYLQEAVKLKPGKAARMIGMTSSG